MKINIKEAISLARSNQSLEGIVIENLKETQVSSVDALLLAENGILIPEQNIYYNDEDIEYDPEFDEVVWSKEPLQMSWEEKFALARELEAQKQKAIPTLHLTTQRPEVDAWLIQNQEKVAQLLQPILISLFEAASWGGEAPRVGEAPWVGEVPASPKR